MIKPATVLTGWPKFPSAALWLPAAFIAVNGE